ncbi:uncharacterized protein METZ01_LOCUS341441 [marine metagenome]|uniref:Uncharacterized protein n=1 Tax=marine metagenome TaxID=408172 RepID=A0A382QUF9_9ZZZZ
MEEYKAQEQTKNIVSFYNLYPDTDMIRYAYCVKPENINIEDFYDKIVEYYSTTKGHQWKYKPANEHIEDYMENTNCIPIAVYPILKKNNHLDELPEIVEHTDEWVEYGVVPLVKTLMNYPGVEIIKSCHGHYNPKDPTWTTDWICYAFVVFKVDELKTLNIISNQLRKTLKLMLQYFQLDDREDWSVKHWYENNGILLSYVGDTKGDTLFEIAFRYEAKGQEKIFQLIEHLGKHLNYENL